MAFCRSCGSPVEGQFCAKCGAPVAAPAGPGAAPPPPSGQPYGAAGQPGDVPPAAASTGLQENVAAALCYVLGLITGILFLALAPYNQNRTIRFHAFQSIFFNVAWIAFWILLAILHMILPWGLSIILSLLSLVVWLGGFVVWILLMVRAYQGNRLVLPVVGQMAQQQA
jgi:uncharacterized membrane protein